jgi:hypothetical protein
MLTSLRFRRLLANSLRNPLSPEDNAAEARTVMRIAHERRDHAVDIELRSGEAFANGNNWMKVAFSHK